MKDVEGVGYLAIAWNYTGQELEVIPAIHSQTSKPGWPVTCADDSDCDDGVWCNGKSSYQGTYLWMYSKHDIDVEMLFSNRR